MWLVCRYLCALWRPRGSLSIEELRQWTSFGAINDIALGGFCSQRFHNGPADDFESHRWGNYFFEERKRLVLLAVLVRYRTWQTCLRQLLRLQLPAMATLAAALSSEPAAPVLPLPGPQLP